MTEFEKILANCRLSLKFNNEEINGDTVVDENSYVNAFDINNVLSVALASQSVMDKLVSSDFIPEDYFDICDPIYKMMCNNVKNNIDKIPSGAFYAASVLAVCFNKPRESIIIDLVV